MQNVEITSISVNREDKTVSYFVIINGVNRVFSGTYRYERVPIDYVSIPGEFEGILHQIDAKSPAILRPVFDIIDGRAVQFPIKLS